jgi:hypothetical protein
VQIDSKEQVQIKTVQVFDLLGKEVYQTTATVFNISHLPQGMYFVKIVASEGATTKKLVKR